jgi:hypothetical protein
MLFLLMARILRRYLGIQPNHKYDRLMGVTAICVVAFFMLLYIVLR